MPWWNKLNGDVIHDFSAHDHVYLANFTNGFADTDNGDIHSIGQLLCFHSHGNAVPNRTRKCWNSMRYNAELCVVDSVIDELPFADDRDHHTLGEHVRRNRYYHAMSNRAGRGGYRVRYEFIVCDMGAHEH